MAFFSSSALWIVVSLIPLVIAVYWIQSRRRPKQLSYFWASSIATISSLDPSGNDTRTIFLNDTVWVLPDTDLGQLVRDILSECAKYDGRNAATSPSLKKKCAFFYAQISVIGVRHVFVSFSGTRHGGSLWPALDSVHTTVTPRHVIPFTFIDPAEVTRDDVAFIPGEVPEDEVPHELLHIFLQLFLDVEKGRSDHSLLREARPLLGWQQNQFQEDIKLLFDERQHLHDRYKASVMNLARRNKEPWIDSTEWLLAKFRYERELGPGVRRVGTGFKQSKLEPGDQAIRTALHNLVNALKCIPPYQIARALARCAEPNMIYYLSQHPDLLAKLDVEHHFWPMTVTAEDAEALGPKKFCDICEVYLNPNFMRFAEQQTPVMVGPLVKFPSRFKPGPPVAGAIALRSQLAVRNEEAEEKKDDDDHADLTLFNDHDVDEVLWCSACRKAIKWRRPKGAFGLIMQERDCTICQLCKVSVHEECMQRHRSGKKHAALAAKEKNVQTNPNKVRRR